MFRLLSFPVLALVLAMPLAACGDGFSPEDAAAECEAIRANPPATIPQCDFDQAAFDQCTACYQECGDGCAMVHTACPITFSCPAD
jgi:hypothetical protein